MVATDGIITLGILPPGMVTINPPTERSCERCGRRERWDEQKQTFVTREENGRVERGEPHCLHEWDINGKYNPLQESES